jgi:hypothetical protein
MEHQYEKQIRIICPYCNKTGSVPVDRGVITEIISQKQDYMVQLAIFPGDVCEHEFSVRIDANFKSR